MGSLERCPNLLDGIVTGHGCVPDAGVVRRRPSSARAGRGSGVVRRSRSAPKPLTMLTMIFSSWSFEAWTSQPSSPPALDEGSTMAAR